jgi:peroxiredoxin-like protein
MSAEHSFKLTANWSGGLSGIGHVESGALNVAVSSPKAFGGPGKGTNPEELLLSAAASCYLITLAAICQRKELAIESITLTSEATTTSPPALKLVSITHHPIITLKSPDDSSRASALDAATKAEMFCMISTALRPNVNLKVEATIL